MQQGGGGLQRQAVIKSQEPGVYYVNGSETWQVGTRYTLLKVLGEGSFSAVCLAHDNITHEKVAVKRIGDVLASLDNAKRVLREVCILKRLNHPNVVRLLDVFLKPSPTGRYVFRGGKLVPTSLDIFLVTEYADSGDLFNMRGQLSDEEARNILYQLLGALSYIHGLHVWHRDIKSANCLMFVIEGRRVAKIADFGSARSAVTESAAAAALRQGQGQGQGGADSASGEAGAGAGGGDGAERCPSCRMDSGEVTPRDPFAVPEPARMGEGGPSAAAASTATKLADVQVRLAGQGGGFLPPLTRMVSTPCYRAPEVVMSRGGYSSAIDMWSLGCIFGELLQRVAYIGSATTPQLQVAPVFAMSGAGQTTPRSGEHFEGGAPGNAITRIELAALFSVIGTPAWACIDGVDSRAWRRYLYRIPGRAPSLQRRFGAAGEVAVDLLSRLLIFDPARRCSAEEALAHEYFAPYHQMEALAGELAATDLMACDDDDLLEVDASDASSEEEVQELLSLNTNTNRYSSYPMGPPGASRSSSRARAGRRSKAARAAAGTAAGAAAGVVGAGAGTKAEVRDILDEDLACSLQPPPGFGAAGGAAFGAINTGRGMGSCGQLRASKTPRLVVASPTSATGAGGAMEVDLLGLADDADTAVQASVAPQASTSSAPKRFWEMSEPALALAALEEELASLGAQGADGDVASAHERMREMLEHEVEDLAERLGARDIARVAAAAAAVSVSSGGGASGGAGAVAGGAQGGSFTSYGPLSVSATAGTGGQGYHPGLPRNSSGQALLDESPHAGAGGMGAAGGGGRYEEWQPDLDPSVAGYKRLPFHADVAAAHVDPQKHLRAGRMGEWTELAAGHTMGPRAGPAWGVTSMPPGFMGEGEDKRKLAEAMSRQHGR